MTSRRGPQGPLMSFSIGGAKAPRGGPRRAGFPPDIRPLDVRHPGDDVSPARPAPAGRLAPDMQT